MLKATGGVRGSTGPNDPSVSFAASSPYAGEPMSVVGGVCGDIPALGILQDQYAPIPENKAFSLQRRQDDAIMVPYKDLIPDSFKEALCPPK